VILVESCGDSRLDGLAMQPIKGKIFPNPPKDLTKGDGYGRITWSFVIHKERS
jgi:hypothetical protein